MSLYGFITDPNAGSELPSERTRDDSTTRWFAAKTDADAAIVDET